MDIAVQETRYFCPKCGAQNSPASLDNEWNQCRCGWKGRVYLFRPIKYDAAQPEQALPENAACAHHPDKKAVAVCEGSGNYICALCVVEIDGKTYSVQHVDAKGKASFGKSFDRTMKRPDYYIPAILLFFGLAPFLFPFLIILYLRMRRQFNSDLLYARLIGKARYTLYGALTVLYTMWAVGFAGSIIAEMLGEFL